MSIRIETDRLIVRPLCMDDLAGMYAMDSDAEVHRYVGGKPTQHIEDEARVIEMVMKQYEELGIGRWAVIEKATGTFAGWTGFKRITEPVNGFVNHLDFGYRFARQYWGKGFATESGVASLRYGIDKMGLMDIHAMTDVNNAASRHVLEKLGFEFRGIFAYDSAAGWREPGEPATWYSYAGK